MGHIYKVFIAVLLGGTLLSGGEVFAGESASNPGAYFSIHVASFKELKNANAFVNSLQDQGNVVFWKGAQVGEKGYFYRIFIGRYKSYPDAEKVWLQLKSKGQVSYKGIFSFRQLLPDSKLKRLSDSAESSLKTPAGKKKRSGPDFNRFVDNGDGTVTDFQSGLMWIQNGWHRNFFSAVTWEAAIAKCRRFKASGYTDWSLPTKAQWRSLLDDQRQAPAIVDPNPFKNVIIHMPYWAKDGPIRLLSRRYTTLLYSGRINHQQKTEMAFIWPVREIK
ncbi:MAG: DUF1566 domain-containing protein [Desulfobacterales bacterium]|nr:DUF1566 domain-containing protein [Desulfobacterales bacterium]